MEEIILDVGDIFMLENSGGACYLVFDVEYIEAIEKYKYYILKIVPVEEEMITFNNTDKYYIEKFADKIYKINTDEHFELLKNIFKIRYLKGWTSTPTFMDIFDNNDKYKSLSHKEINVDYLYYETMDEALDNLNLLAELHREFGDEEYIEIRNELLQQLKEEAENTRIVDLPF